MYCQRVVLFTSTVRELAVMLGPTPIGTCSSCSTSLKLHLQKKKILSFRLLMSAGI